MSNTSPLSLCCLWLMINLSYFVTRPMWKSHGLGQVFSGTSWPNKNAPQIPWHDCGGMFCCVAHLGNGQWKGLLKVTQTRQAAVTQLGVWNSSSKASLIFTLSPAPGTRVVNWVKKTSGKISNQPASRGYQLPVTMRLEQQFAAITRVTWAKKIHRFSQRNTDWLIGSPLSEMAWNNPQIITQYLVGGWVPPLKNMKVSWDYDIPNVWKNKNIFQTTNQVYFPYRSFRNQSTTICHLHPYSLHGSYEGTKPL